MSDDGEKPPERENLLDLLPAPARLVMALIVLVVILLCVLFSLVFGNAPNLPGHWCEPSVFQVTCYRDWLGVIGGFVAVAVGGYSIALIWRQIRHAEKEARKATRQSERAIRTSIALANQPAIEWLGKIAVRLEAVERKLKAEREDKSDGAVVERLGNEIRNHGGIFTKSRDLSGVEGDVLNRSASLRNRLSVVRNLSGDLFNQVTNLRSNIFWPKYPDDDRTFLKSVIEYENAAGDCAGACRTIADALRVGISQQELFDATLEEIEAATRRMTPIGLPEGDGDKDG